MANLSQLHGPDRDAVRAVQRLVQARGLTTFLDRDSLPRGLPWLPELNGHWVPAAA